MHSTSLSVRRRRLLGLGVRESGWPVRSCGGCERRFGVGGDGDSCLISGWVVRFVDEVCGAGADSSSGGGVGVLLKVESGLEASLPPSSASFSDVGGLPSLARGSALSSVESRELTLLSMPGLSIAVFCCGGELRSKSDTSLSLRLTL